jgi:hypothetical protein
VHWRRAGSGQAAQDPGRGQDPRAGQNPGPEQPAPHACARHPRQVTGRPPCGGQLVRPRRPLQRAPSEWQVLAVVGRDQTAGRTFAARASACNFKAACSCAGIPWRSALEHVISPLEAQLGDSCTESSYRRSHPVRRQDSGRRLLAQRVFWTCKRTVAVCPGQLPCSLRGCSSTDSLAETAMAGVRGRD